MDTQDFRICFGENLKRFRKLKNLTQSELAENIGIETHNLNRIENGKSFPQLKTIIKIVDFFQISAYELFLTPQDKIATIVDKLQKNPDKVDDFYKIVLALID